MLPGRCSASAPSCSAKAGKPDPRGPQIWLFDDHIWLQSKHGTYYLTGDALRALSWLVGVLDLDATLALVDQARARIEAAQGRLARLAEEAVKATAERSLNEPK